MTESTLEVSVIIPAYGVAPFIVEALSSVIGQTEKRWEVIVVNDGSPDTQALEAALDPFRDRISYHSQPNLGVAAARNAAVRIARGRWLAFLDGDDLWEPAFLARQLQFLEANGLDMAWSDGWYAGDVAPSGSRLMAIAPCRGPVTVMALLTGAVSVTTSATVVRRQLVEAAGGFDEALLRGQDFDLWVRLLHRGIRAGYNPEALIRYRVRPGSLSGDEVAQAERAVTVVRGLRTKLRFTKADAAALDERIADLEAHLALATGKRHLARGEYDLAGRELRAAKRGLPSARLRIALVLLRLMPGLVRRLHLARNPGEGR
ncbi:MAG: glycosyltransferase family 2 protein [Gemmatimonadales bacterium]